MDFKLQNKFHFRNMTKNERDAYLAYHEISKRSIAIRHRVSVVSVHLAIKGEPGLRKLLTRISYGLYGQQEKKVIKAA